MNFDISLWLIPKKEQEKQIEKTINSLTIKYSVFSFIPHITIYHFGTISILNDINSFIDKKLAKTHRFNLDFERIDFSDIFTKTLFAKYKINTSLIDLYKTFHNKYKGIKDYQLTPHLSLIYKTNMNKGDKLKEAQNITLPLKITIDRLYVITKKNGDIKIDKDVLQWKIVHKLYLK